jgi:hypothetical protein
MTKGARVEGHRQKGNQFGQTNATRKSVELPQCHAVFERWAGEPIKFGFGRKPILAYQRQPIFAELLILRLLEAHVWDGVWVSSYGGIKYLRQMPQDSSLANVQVPPAR